MLHAVCAFAIVLTALTFAAPPAATQAGKSSRDASPRILVFTKTAGFRHDSIPEGIAAMNSIGVESGIGVDASEDASTFTDESLKAFRVVVFLNTTGDVLNDQQQAAFERFIQGGGGFVGIHSATDTEYDWPWYTKLVAGHFASHPEIQPATINVNDRTHESTSHLPEKWSRTDEWYNFRDPPAEKAGGTLRILARLDESTYKGGSMPADHPVVWCQEFDGGRSWYTALGHTKESYAEPAFLDMIRKAILWAGKIEKKPEPAAESPR
jgi:type 1 glutamine amidotransferase